MSDAQQRAAKTAGVIYLAAMATSMFSELVVRNRLIVAGNVEQTAKNIISSARLFRLAITLDVMTFVACVVLAWALYVILRPVHENLTLLATFLRLVENAILAAATMNAHAALKILTAGYMSGVDPATTHALARMWIAVQGNGLQTGFVFTGLGQLLFSIVWLKSRYIPKWLAVLGIVASFLLGFGSLVTMLVPEVFTAIGLSYMAPMFFYEVGLGLWLLIKGLRAPAQ